MEVLKHCIKMEGKEVPSNKVGFLNFHLFVLLVGNDKS